MNSTDLIRIHVTDGTDGPVAWSIHVTIFAHHVRILSFHRVAHSKHCRLLEWATRVRRGGHRDVGEPRIVAAKGRDITRHPSTGLYLTWSIELNQVTCNVTR
jgi:hypothetical protein